MPKKHSCQDWDGYIVQFFMSTSPSELALDLNWTLPRVS